MVILQLEEQPPIVQAIFVGGEPERIKDLIKFKQDVNCLDCDKRTPLHAAAFKGDATIASVLLSNGARVNAKDSKWITPLHRACSIGSSETVSVLLTYQAEVNARDKLWQTPLHVAAGNGAYECIEQLLSHVPNPNR
ncbi:hypothetical protein GEV33_000994 [Tenebrio molitor]|uniref:Uncharacterized protein n=1 Tax=Tenebrio molitor TaxID=7067 RepID=A0A8J6LKE7_TENMO|nr:hypothetical protein GEV33_000994 [Tenebrio molitor]